MAYQFLSDNLKDDLLKVDILGAKGCQFAPSRCNLLIEVTDRWFNENDMVLEIQRHSPEGFGFDYFMIDILEIPTSTVISGKDQMIWDVNTTIPPSGQLIWVLGVKEVNMVRGVWDLAYLYDDKSSWMLAPTPTIDHQPLRCLEFFAGAYGGWKGALEVLSKQGVKSQTVGIEMDERASKAYAISHYANWMGPHVNIPNDWFVQNHENWIWQQDVLNDSILGPCTFWQPHLVTISSPCPDWSSAGTAQGLLKPGAKLLLQTILACRWIRPMYIAIEQVSNFNNHEHKHWIMKSLHMVGFRLMWQKVCNLTGHAQTARLRWLGLAKRTADQVPMIPFTMWPAREPDWPAITLPFSREDKNALVIDANIAELASSPAFLKTTLSQLPSPDVIFSKRIYRPTDVFPTIMALYGQQHHMNRDFLKKHGYLAHFVQDPDVPYQCRFLHPAEIAILHGSCNKVYIDGDLKQA